MLPAPRDNLRGIAWILFSVLAASGMSVAVRELSGGLDSRMIVLLRATLSSAAILALLATLPRLRASLRFTRPATHITRGLLIALSTHLGFYTLAEIPLATAAILFFTAPIFATILAGPLLGEHVGPRRWAAVAAGFAGALIILRPGVGDLHPAMLAALGSSAFFAIALLQSRGLAEADGPFSAFTSSVIITALATLPFMSGGWGLPPTGFAWAITGLLVITGAARGIADIQAYRHGEASILGPITYLRLVLVGLAGYLFYGEIIDGPTLIGAAIIIASTLYISQRAARQAQNRRRAASAAEIVPSSR
ncbi:DMT family transporter [Algicella marina]|nr:DMT family transporter [Algicella marina]